MTPLPGTLALSRSFFPACQLEAIQRTMRAKNTSLRALLQDTAKPKLPAKIDRRRLERAQRCLADVRALRRASGLSQTDFWRRYGVTQSAGSRFENGRAMSVSVQILVLLDAFGYVDKSKLVEAVKFVEEGGRLPVRRVSTK